MATEFTKNYSVDVTYKLDDLGTIAEDDMNVEVLRTLIIKRISEACRMSKGIIQGRPGDITET